jgi:PST family polysaccharide transporter
LNGEVLMALGRAGTLLRFTAVWFVVTVGAFALGIHWGVLGVAVSYAISTTLIEPLRTYLTTRALGIPMTRFFRAFAGLAQATVFMAAVLIPTRVALVGAGVPAGARLALLVLLGCVAYAIGCLLRAPETMAELKRALRRRRRSATPPADALAPRFSQD